VLEALSIAFSASSSDPRSIERSGAAGGVLDEPAPELSLFPQGNPGAIDHTIERSGTSAFDGTGGPEDPLLEFGGGASGEV
jgi:hypothetical protein